MNRPSKTSASSSIFPSARTLKRARRTLVVALSLTSLISLYLFADTTAPDDAPPSSTGAASSQIALRTAGQSAPRTVEQAREAYGQLPLSFEANRGQADESVNFVARGAGYTLALSPTEAVFALSRRSVERSQSGESLAGRRDMNVAATRARRDTDTSNAPRSEQPPTVLRMNLVGASGGASVAGLNELEGKVNYFTGNDPAQWRTNIPTFGRVRYSEVYPGIDVVYYGNQRQLEYDFIVAPGSDARAVRLRFEGADKIEVDAAGDLLLKVGESVVRQPKPFVYQEVAGVRRAVEGAYSVENDGRVGFALGEYDAALPLVIDPVLVYSTYLGGSGDESARDITLDASGNAYFCGGTTSTNFPTANAYDSMFNTGNDPADADAFVTKLNSTGTALVYSTYLGGTGTNVNLSGDDVCTGIAIDSAGNAYLAGETRSTDFPLANAFDTTFGGAFEGYLTKLNAGGNALVYSTYIGGESFDSASSVAVDSSNNPYVAGRTTSSDFPTLNPIQSTFAGGGSDAFVMKFDAEGSALIYSTYLGGGGGNGFDAAFGLAIDPAGNAYITGPTISTDFPTFNPIQATFGGGTTGGDGYVAKIDATGSALVYSTYLGGSNNDLPQHIIADSSGNAYVTGGTESTNFPTANAFDSMLTGTSDAFVTKLNPTGSAFVYSTYLGGGAVDGGNDIRVDSSNNAHVTGFTGSTDFPTVNPIQAANGGGNNDAFLLKLNTEGSALLFSTYLGGAGADSGFALGLDSTGNMYVAGITLSTNFPTLNPLQAANGGGEDAFVTKIDPSAAPAPATLQFAQATYTIEEDINFITLTVTRTGDSTSAATVDFETSNGTASERRDYTTALGTLRFASGETSQTFDLLVNEDSFTEGMETFTVALSNPTGGASLGTPAAATVQITDDASEPTTNAIDDAGTFVGQHYHDFLNRQHDLPGHAFWTNEITLCGADAACTDFRRMSVSGAYFVSIEFQGTGFEVIRTYKATFDDSPARPRGVPRYREFMRDMREIQRGVVVGMGNWQQQLQMNMLDFARAWVQKPEVLAVLPANMTAEQFVDKLFQNVEVTPTQAERDAALSAFGAGGTEGRARALLSVVGSGSVFNRQFNCAFVLMQYFGYLRRSPDDAPDTSFAGFDFWLSKLDSFTLPGEDVRDELTARRRIFRAEMVRAFLISAEYRSRFGQP